jgi:drug/metabolite transporter (DMT)-like permease
MNKSLLPSFLLLPAFLGAFVAISAYKNGSIIGLMVMIISAICYAAAYVMVVLGKENFIKLAFGGFILAGIYLLPTGIKTAFSVLNEPELATATLLIWVIIALYGFGFWVVKKTA